MKMALMLGPGGSGRILGLDPLPPLPFNNVYYPQPSFRTFYYPNAFLHHFPIPSHPPPLPHFPLITPITLDLISKPCNISYLHEKSQIYSRHFSVQSPPPPTLPFSNPIYVDFPLKPSIIPISVPAPHNLHPHTLI